MAALSADDKHFLMENALLECAIEHDLSTDDLLILEKGKSHYLVSRKTNEDGSPVKVYFIKTF